MENEVWTDIARIPLVFMSQNCYPLQYLNLIWFWVYLRHILTGGASFSDCTASRNLPLRLTYFKPDKNPCGWSEEDTNISFHTLENIFSPLYVYISFLEILCSVPLDVNQPDPDLWEEPSLVQLLVAIHGKVTHLTCTLSGRDALDRSRKGSARTNFLDAIASPSSYPVRKGSHKKTGKKLGLTSLIMNYEI